MERNRVRSVSSRRLPEMLVFSIFCAFPARRRSSYSSGQTSREGDSVTAQSSLSHYSPRSHPLAEALEGRTLMSTAVALTGNTLLFFDTATPGVTLGKVKVRGLQRKESL